jgi:DNA-binding YbaB/EbfC family protein
MAKKPPSFRGKPKKSGRPGAGDIMGKMQRMQDDMAAAQEALASESVTVTAGGGVISIEITGHQRITSIEVDEALLDVEEKEMLQDLLVAAVNQAIEQSQALAAQRMEGITGNMGGLGDLLGGMI